MRIDLGGVIRDVWAMLRRDEPLLLPIVGLLAFVPQLAVLLLVPLWRRAEPGATIAAQVTAYAEWAGAHAHWWLASAALGFVAELALLALYLDRARPDVGGAIVRGVGLWPRALVASALLSVPTRLGFVLLVIPGLYLMARTMLAYPALAARRPGGAVEAIRLSLRLTRGVGLPLAAALAIGYYLPQFVANMMFVALSDMGAGSPAARTVLALAAAALVAASILATALIEVVAYRRLAESSSGT